MLELKVGERHKYILYSLAKTIEFLHIQFSRFVYRVKTASYYRLFAIRTAF